VGCLSELSKSKGRMMLYQTLYALKLISSPSSFYSYLKNKQTNKKKPTGVEAARQLRYSEIHLDI